MTLLAAVLKTKWILALPLMLERRSGRWAAETCELLTAGHWQVALGCCEWSRARVFALVGTSSEGRSLGSCVSVRKLSGSTLPVFARAMRSSSGTPRCRQQLSTSSSPSAKLATCAASSRNSAGYPPASDCSTMSNTRCTQQQARSSRLVAWRSPPESARGAGSLVEKLGFTQTFGRPCSVKPIMASSVNSGPQTQLSVLQPAKAAERTVMASGRCSARRRAARVRGMFSTRMCLLLGKEQRYCSSWARMQSTATRLPWLSLRKLYSCSFSSESMSASLSGQAMKRRPSLLRSHSWCVSRSSTTRHSSLRSGDSRLENSTDFEFPIRKYNRREGRTSQIQSPYREGEAMQDRLEIGRGGEKQRRIQYLMDKIYFLLFTAVLLFLITAYHYALPTPTSLTTFCHPESSLCAFCPLFTPLHPRHFDAKAYVLSNARFSVLVSKPGSNFKKTLCKEYLKAVTPSLTWNPNEQLNQSHKSEEIMLIDNNFVPFTGVNFRMMERFGDLIVFSRNQGSMQPSVYLQGQHNSDSLLKYARVMGWSSLWAIIIAALASRLGFEIFSTDKSLLPMLQVVGLASSLFCSSDRSFFEYFPVIEAMYLTIIWIKLDPSARSKKVEIVLWMIGCVVWNQMVAVGQMYASLCLWRESSRQNAREARIIGGLITVGLVFRLLKILIPLGFLEFISLLWSIILFPVCLLILQTTTQDKQLQSQTNEII